MLIKYAYDLVISLHGLRNWAEIQGGLFLCSPLYFGVESYFDESCYTGYMLKVAGIICFGLVCLIYFTPILIRKVSKNSPPPKIHDSEHCNKHSSLRPVTFIWNITQHVKFDLYLKKGPTHISN
jgi:hypothetical protein